MIVVAKDFVGREGGQRDVIADHCHPHTSPGRTLQVDRAAYVARQAEATASTLRPLSEGDAGPHGWTCRGPLKIGP